MLRDFVVAVGYKPSIVGSICILIGIVLLTSYPALVASTADQLDVPLGASEHLRVYGVLRAVDDYGIKPSALVGYNGTPQPTDHLMGVRITNRSFQNLTFSAVIFERTLFVDVTFEQCRFENVAFRHSGFMNTTVRNCVFQDCQFINVRSGPPGGKIVTIDAVDVRLLDRTGTGRNEQSVVLPGTGVGIFCTVQRYEPTLPRLVSVLGVSDLNGINGTRFVHSTIPVGFDGYEPVTTRSSIQPVWIYYLWFSVIIAAGIIVIISNVLIIRNGWRWLDFWKFCGPLGLVVAYMFLLFLLLPWLTFFILASGMVIYTVPPAGKETIIPAMTLLTGNPTAAAISLAVVDLAGALFLIWNFWIIEMIPILGRWVKRSEGAGERLLERRPWFAKMAFVGVTLFVIFPFQGSGGWGATILGRVIGMGYRKVYGAVVLGTLIGNFAIAYIAYYMGPTILAAFETSEFKLLGIIIVVVIIILVIYLIRRNIRRPKNSDRA